LLDTTNDYLDEFSKLFEYQDQHQQENKILLKSQINASNCFMDELDDFSFNNNDQQLNCNNNNIQQSCDQQKQQLHTWSNQHGNNSIFSLQQQQQQQQQQTTKSNDLLSNYMFDSLDGFFFLINSNGIIQFISENVVNFIKYSQVSLLNLSLSLSLSAI
jgi:hypothetical protein